ncbi:hypothetical protein SDC9_41238 [bioreactor metagenome]|uniref:Uncharacterized protein n=1 Tax=bioreactor metagenome TaxID=1076179 RepID=A0A644VUG3_9ZZZZ
MANTKTNSATRAKSSAVPKTKTETTAAAEQAPVTETKKKRLTLAEVSLNDLVEVQSCFYGSLVYVSSKTGYRIEWGEFGASQYMPVEEVMTMRNSQPTFFTNQWVRIIGDNASDVMNFLQLDRYYSKTAKVDSFDDLFAYTPAKIEEVVSTFTDSMKESFARYTHSLVQNGEIDSIKKIDAIERATGFEIKE